MKCKKTMLSQFLCMIMLLALVVKPPVAEATENACIYEEYTNVANTYRGENKTYPKDKAGYVFAGWYSKSGSAYLPMREATADVATTAYAKFVKQEVLSMRFQLAEGTTAIAKDTTLRLITSVDSLEYASVGFRIQLGEDVAIRTSKVVYSAINGYTKDGMTSYTPGETFHTSSQYFMTYSISQITTDVFSSNWSITPMWTTLDGTTVDGVTKDKLAIINQVPDGTFDVLTFEDKQDVHNLVGSGQVKSLNRVAYADVTPTINTDASTYGAYALKATLKNYWPAFTIDLGKAYETDVTLKFSAYLQIDVAYIKENYYPIDSGVVSPNYGKFNTWQTFTITVPANTQQYTFGYNFELNGRVTDVTKMSIYFDNMNVTLPQQPFNTLDFEKAQEMNYLTTPWPISRQTTAGLAAVAGSDSYGNYVLQLEAGASLYPRLNIDFKKSYAEAVTISFDVYVEVDAAKVKNNRYIYEVGGSWARSDLQFNRWERITKTLPAGTSSVQLMANLEYFASLESGTTTTFYIDNIKLQ